MNINDQLEILELSGIPVQENDCIHHYLVMCAEKGIQPAKTLIDLISTIDWYFLNDRNAVKGSVLYQNPLGVNRVLGNITK